MLFVVLCGSKAIDKADLWETLAAQLGVGKTHGQFLQGLLEQKGLLRAEGATAETWPALGISSQPVCTMPHLAVDLYASLLPVAARKDFKAFRAFTIFRDTATSCCTKVLGALVELRPQESKETEKLLKKEEKKKKKKLGDDAGVPEQGCVRHLMAAVRGAARRATEPSQGDFHDAEHAGAAAAVSRGEAS